MLVLDPAFQAVHVGACAARLVSKLTLVSASGHCRCMDGGTLCIAAASWAPGGFFFSTVNFLCEEDCVTKIISVGNPVELYFYESGSERNLA